MYSNLLSYPTLTQLLCDSLESSEESRAGHNHILYTQTHTPTVERLKQTLGFYFIQGKHLLLIHTVKSISHETQKI